MLSVDWRGEAGIARRPQRTSAVSVAYSRGLSLVCFDCGRVPRAGEECPKHPGEPLLDSEDPEVRAEMRKVDGQRWARHLTLCSLPVVAATIIAGVILEGWYLGRDDELP